MGLRDFFTIKSRKQREQEQQQYNQWAFPYGPEQTAVVAGLLDQLLPEEKGFSVAVFLIGKEAWHKAPNGESLQQMEAAFYAMASHLTGKKKLLIWRYLALLEADAQARTCNDYPDAAALLARACQLQTQYS